MNKLPEIVAHCDWGSQPSKRWIAIATLQSGSYLAYAPQPVGEMSTLIARLRRQSGRNACIVIGFDFPIGLPSAYAERCGIGSYPDFLQQLTSDASIASDTSDSSTSGSSPSRWSRFHEVCSTEEEITLERPFYPLRPGGARRDAIHEALGFADRNQLYRECELRHAARTSASSLFWTLGGNQVGKSALLGWLNVLGPQLAQKSESFRLWPFHGTLEALLRPGVMVAMETYPTEYHGRIFGHALRGKRYAAQRIDLAPAWLESAHRLGIRMDRKLKRQILSGFVETISGEQQTRARDEQDDPLDATIGLFGMLATLKEYGPQFEPNDQEIRTVEGWIFGLTHPLQRAG